MNKLAELSALQSFVNSLLLTKIKYNFIKSNNNEILSIEDKFQVAITKSGSSFLRYYQFPILKNGQEISLKNFFVEMTTLLSRDQKNTENFLKRICHSLNYQTLIYQNGIASNISDEFIVNEQTHFMGHYSHPYPKYRGDDTVETFNYSPEQNKKFELAWYLIPTKHLKTEQASNDSTDYILELQKMYGLNINQYNLKEYTLIPYHPYQSEKIRPILDIIGAIEIRSNEQKWQSTSSTRTIYNPHSKWMIKYSMSIRITNSIRLLQKEEIKRGPILSAVINSNYGKKITSDETLKNFKILQEPFYFAIADNNGEIIPETFGLLRENLNHSDIGKYAQLATLTQPYNENGDARVLISANKTNKIEWYRSYLQNALLPILILQSKYGIYVGAHQQNLILELDKNDLVIGSFYRDCQGTGFNPKAAQILSDEINIFKSEQENVIDTAFLNNLINYYLMLNSTYSLIFSLANGDKSLEKSLTLETIKEIQSLLKRPDLLDKSLLNHIVNNQNILIKDNFTCCLDDINENTISNPLDIYRSINNPFYFNEKDMNYTIKRITGESFLINSNLNNSTIEITDSEKTFLFQYKNEFQTIRVNCSLNSLSTTLKNTLCEALFNLNHEASQIEDEAKTQITRLDFFQTKNLWAKNRELNSNEFTETNGVKHPVRPKYKEGEILYSKYNPIINATISVRMIDRNRDLETFHNWHNQERVNNFWELAGTKEEHLNYMTKGLNDPHQIPTIIEINNESVGYFEIYWTPEDRLGPIYDHNPYDRGFHLLIGNQNFLGFKNTDSILKAVVHLIYLENSKTFFIMGEPRHDNEKMIRYVDTFPAWRKVKVFDFPHKRAVLLECNRDLFFQGKYL